MADTAITAYTATIIREIENTLSTLHGEQTEDLVRLLNRSDRIFLAGAGRSGYMIKGFAMRLMHTGRTVYVVGETVTPAIQQGDLLIIASGSGETKSLASMAAKAKELGAALIAVTIKPDSTIGQLADSVLRLPAAAKSGEEGRETTVQPMGSLFEQSLLIYFDALILKLMDSQQLSSSDLYRTHANLE